MTGFYSSEILSGRNYEIVVVGTIVAIVIRQMKANRVINLKKT